MEFETPIFLGPMTQMICYPPPPRKHLSPRARRPSLFVDDEVEISDDESQPVEITVNFTRKSIMNVDIVEQLIKRQTQYSGRPSPLSKGHFVVTRIPSEPSSLPSRY